MFFLCLKCMLGCQIQCFKLGCVSRVSGQKLAHSSLIMHMQGSSCVCMNLPRNRNFYLFVFASVFTCLFCLASFSMFLCFQILCFTCLIAQFVSHVRIKVLLFQCHEHALTCSCIMPQVLSCCKVNKGKSCICGLSLL